MQGQHEDNSWHLAGDIKLESSDDKQQEQHGEPKADKKNVEACEGITYQ